MPKPFANSQPITPSLISGDWLLGIQTGNSTGDNGLPQMKYIKLSQLTDWVRSNFGEMWRYRGGFSASLPSDPQDGDYFLAIATFTVGADTYTENHLYAYNGSSWDDISDVLTQYASQAQVTDIDDRLTAAEEKIDSMGDGIVYKGEVATYADLAGIVDPQTGWEYYVTADAAFYVYNGASWDQIDNGIVQTITDGDTTHAPSGDAVYDALASEASAREAADSNLKDAITTVHNELQSDYESIMRSGKNIIELPQWEQGAIGGTGVPYNDSNNIRSSGLLHIKAGEYWVNPNGLNTYFFYYTSTGTFVGVSNWGASSAFRLFLFEDKYMKFSQAKSGGLTPSGATLTIDETMPREQYELQKLSNGIVIMSKQGEGLGVPPQSLISIKQAFKNLYDGYRINVCKTSDGHYVLSHDRSINSVAKNPNGTDISGTVNIDEHTLAELNEYDYGIRYGSQFAGMEITELADAVSLCAKLGLRLDIEWKYPTMIADDAEAIYDIIVTNGYSNKNWHWIAYNETIIGYFKSVCDYVDIEVLVSSGSVDYYLPVINEAKSDNHNVIVGYSDGNYSDENVIKLRKMNIVQNKGTATNLAQMIEQIEHGVTELECNFYNPKQAMVEYALNN